MYYYKFVKEVYEKMAYKNILPLSLNISALRENYGD
jgi:hypothetical protein